MQATELLQVLRSMGLTVTRVGPHLCVAPACQLTDKLRASIREQRPALLALLDHPERPEEPAVDLGVLVERVGLHMQRLTREAREWSDAEWIWSRDQVLADMDWMDTELARRNETVADYGWTFSPTGIWHRLK
jgi:hypothetical protein